MARRLHTDVHSLTCVSAERKLPTTIRGTCIDLVCANFDTECQQEPLSVHFTDHKVVESRRNACQLQSSPHVLSAETTRPTPAIASNKSSSAHRSTHISAFQHVTSLCTMLLLRIPSGFPLERCCCLFSLRKVCTSHIIMKRWISCSFQ